MNEFSELPAPGATPKTLVIPSAAANPSVMKTTPGQIISVNEVLFVLRRWWWRCTLLGIPLAVAAAAVVWVTFVPQYEARALLKIDNSPDGTGFSRSSEALSTQLEIIRSDITLSLVAANSNVASLREISGRAPIDWLRSNLRVGYVGQSALLQIAFKAREPKTASDVANTVLKSYLSINLEKTTAQTKNERESLKERCDSRKRAIQQLRESVLGMIKQQTGAEPLIVDGKNYAMPSNQLTVLESQYTAAEVARVLKEAKLDAYNKAIKEEVLEVPHDEMEKALATHPQMQALRSRYDDAESALTKYKQIMPKGPANPVVQRQLNKYAEDVRIVEEALQKARGELVPKLQQEMQDAMRAHHEKLIAETEADIANQTIIEGVLKTKMAEERTRIGKVSNESQELAFKRDELRRAEEVYEKLMDESDRFDLKDQRIPEVMHEAVAPEEPLEAWPFKKCGMASALAFLLPFGLAFGWEKLLRRIRSAEQLGAEVNLPVLGEVTTLPTRWMLPGRRSSDRFMRDRVTFEESIESLRLGLTLCPNFQDLQTVVVTSAISQEGKTSVATALALSVARCTQDLTLLIDADMRAPNAHEMFGISLGPGLAEVLEGTVNVDDAIAAKGLSVHVLPAGELKVSPHVVMKDGAFVRLLEQLKTKYRYIIIDAPPVLAAAEALLVASSADGALVCTMRDRSRMPQLSTACQRLTHSGARLVGAVISGVPTRDWAQKYGSYGYGYGYGYGSHRRGESAEEPSPSADSREVIVQPKQSDE